MTTPATEQDMHGGLGKVTAKRSWRVAFLMALCVSPAARAEAPVDPFLACSAEFLARHEYNRGLELTNAGHQKFLMDRATLFLRLAMYRAPLEGWGCGDSQGLALGLVWCRGPADLGPERRALMQDRLAVLVAENGPDYPLPVCMEEADCSQCLRLLDASATPP